MKVTEADIVPVITAASPKMSDSQYVTCCVNQVMIEQPHLARYVLAYQNEISVDGVVTVLFYAALLIESVERALGRPSRRITYADLDLAAQAAPSLEVLAQSEGDLASFIYSNITLAQGDRPSTVARTVLCHVAQALVCLSAR